MDITIIGLGVVGSALYAALRSDIRCDIYDEHSQEGIFIDQKIFTNFVFVCVDTPMDEIGKQDASKIKKVLSGLEDQQYEGIVIIKSTVLYENVSDFKLNIVMNPEFLTSNNSIDDFISDTYIVLGGKIEYTKDVALLYTDIFNMKNELKFEYCTMKEAIDFKYARNLRQAWDITYWEMLHDMDMNSRKIHDMMKHTPHIDNFIVGLDGYRGFGQSNKPDAKNFSACLDKDLNALSNVWKLPILKEVDSFNKDLNK